jgi:hypothetical protein
MTCAWSDFACAANNAVLAMSYVQQRHTTCAHVRCLPCHHSTCVKPMPWREPEVAESDACILSLLPATGSATSTY